MLGEPQVYGLAKYRLNYSVGAIILMAVVTLLEFQKFSLGWLIFLILLAFYLFTPFVYRLIVSNDAISSINLFGTKTLEWIEIEEIKPKNGGIVLINVDSDIKVFINPQIDDYPEVVKFIQQKRPDLWKLQETREFHQNILPSIFMLIVGVGLLVAIGILVFREGFSEDEIVPVLVMLTICAFAMWTGLSKIWILSIEEDMLIVKYLLWKRQFHVNEVESVDLEQEMGKNEINYPIHIKLRNGNQVVLERVNEGNPILLNALENWLKKYKVSSS